MSYPRCQLTDDVCVAAITLEKRELDLDGWDVDCLGDVDVTGGADGFRFWNGIDADMGAGAIGTDGNIVLTGDGSTTLLIDNLDFVIDTGSTGTASYVTATDSEVTGTGPEMDATDDTSTDGGGNVRWDFGTSSQSSQSADESSSSSSLSSLSTESSASSVTSQSSLSSSSYSSSSSIIFHLPTSVTLVQGVHSSGTVNDARQVDATYYEVTEQVANPSLGVWFEFQEVPDTTNYDLRLVGRYLDAAATGDHLTVNFFNWNTSSWVNSFQKVPSSSGDLDLTFGIPDSADYLDGSGTLRVRFSAGNETRAGDITNTFRVDLIEVVGETTSSSSSPSSSSLSTLTSLSSTSLSSLSSLSSSSSSVSSSSVSSSSSSIEQVVIPSGYDEATGETVTSTSMSDIPNLSCTVDVPTGGAYVVAFFSADVESDTVDNGFFAIDIDGTDSIEFERKFGSTGDSGCVTAVYRTTTSLAAGTYTVKGRMRAENAGTTLTANNASITAIAMATTEGNTIPSGSAEGTDTVASTTLEDIDGITDNVTLAHRNHIFAALAASTEVATSNKTITVGLDINGETATQERYHSNQDRGSEGIILQTLSTAIAGTRTSKGIWSRQAGGGTCTGAFGLVTFGLEDGVDSIDSAYAQIPSTATVATSTWEEIGGADIKLNHDAYVFAAMSIECSHGTAGGTGSYRLNFGGTPGIELTRYFSSANRTGNVMLYGRSATKMPAGTATVSGEHYTPAGTLTSIDTHGFVMALESTPLIFDSSSSSSQSSSSQSSSSSSSSSLSSSSLSSLSSSSYSSSSSVIFHLPKTFLISPGTYDGGNVNDARQVNGVYQKAGEVAGPPALRVDFAFTEVPNLIDYDCRFVGRYTGTANVKLVLYNYDTTSWDAVTGSTTDLQPSGTSDEDLVFGLPDDAKYLNAQGTCRIAFEVSGAGTGGQVWTDLIQLVEATSSSSSQSTSTSQSSLSSTSVSSSSTGATLSALSEQTSLSSETTSLSTASSQSTSTSTSASTQSTASTQSSSSTSSQSELSELTELSSSSSTSVSTVSSGSSSSTGATLSEISSESSPSSSLSTQSSSESTSLSSLSSLSTQSSSSTSVSSVSSSSSTSQSTLSSSSTGATLSDQTSLSSTSESSRSSSSTSQSSLSSTSQSSLSSSSSLSSPSTQSSQSTLSSQSSSQTSLSSSSSPSSSQSSSSTSLSSLSSATSLSSSSSTSVSSLSTLSSQSSSSSSVSSQSSSPSSVSTQSSQSSSQSTSTSVSSSSQSSLSSSSTSSGEGLFPAGATAARICPSTATVAHECPSGASAAAVCPTGGAAAQTTT